MDTKTIEEITGTLIDYRGKTPPKSENGIRLITAKVIKKGRILDDKYEYITEETYKTWMRRGFPEKGDVLITTEAPLGEVAQLRTPDRVALAQRVILLRGKPEIMNQRFYYYSLQSPYAQAELNARATGTTVAGIKQSELRKVKIPYFKLDSQNKIASILSAYDDLIENNLKRIKILEEMAQMIYREWFGNFHFPGHEKVKMVDSPLGKIPEGWEVKKLGYVCDIVMGQSPKSEFYNTEGKGLPFHQGVKDYGSRFPTHVTYCTVESRIAELGDILISVRAPVGRINLANTKLIIGRGLSAVRHKRALQSFLLYQLKEIFREEDSMGSGTIYKAITKSDLLGLKMICPSSELDRQFDELVAPMDAEIENLTMKVTNLRKTRDLLLPKLISGELDVENLDIRVPEEKE